MHLVFSNFKAVAMGDKGLFQGIERSLQVIYAALELGIWNCELRFFFYHFFWWFYEQPAILIILISFPKNVLKFLVLSHQVSRFFFFSKWLIRSMQCKYFAYVYYQFTAWDISALFIANRVISVFKSNKIRGAIPQTPELIKKAHP